MVARPCMIAAMKLFDCVVPADAT